ncbi:MAG TPA: hypothetical protein VIJ52_02345 [Pseudolabrys sp.]
MRKFSILMSACAFTLIGMSTAFAGLPVPAYVDVKNGNDTNTGLGCAFLTPCATLNAALSVSGAGSAIIVLGGGLFGPIVLTGGILILGNTPDEEVNIFADPTAQVGCLGHLPGSCGLNNNGYAVEVLVDPTTSDEKVTLHHVSLRAGGGSAAGALKFTSGKNLDLDYDTFEGGGSGAALELSPFNSNNQPATVYLANSNISGGNGTGASGAVQVRPTGSTSVQLHFNHDQVHNTDFGIRTDGTQLASGPNNVVNTTVSDCQFFAIQFAAVNAVSIAGHGQVVATFASNQILNTQAGLKANGPLSFVVLSNNTVTGNQTGVQVQNGASVYTAGNNVVTFSGPGGNLSGTLQGSSPLL